MSPSAHFNSPPSLSVPKNWEHDSPTTMIFTFIWETQAVGRILNCFSCEDSIHINYGLFPMSIIKIHTKFAYQCQEKWKENNLKMIGSEYHSALPRNPGDSQDISWFSSIPLWWQWEQCSGMAWERLGDLGLIPAGKPQRPAEEVAESEGI